MEVMPAYNVSEVLKELVVPQQPRAVVGGQR